MKKTATLLRLTAVGLSMVVTFAAVTTLVGLVVTLPVVPTLVGAMAACSSANTVGWAVGMTGEDEL